MQKKSFLWVLLLVSFIQITAQSKYADSLNLALVAQTDTHDKIATLGLLAAYHINIYPDSAVANADEIITLAKNSNDPAAESLGYYYRGFAFDHLANYTNALQAALKCFEIAETIPAGKSLIKGKACELLGHLYSITGDSKKALDFYQEGNEFINRHNGPRKEFYNLYGRLGNLLMSTKPDSGIYYTKICYQYAMAIPPDQRSGYPYLVLWETSRFLGKIDSAKKYLLDGILFSKENNCIFYLNVFQNAYSYYLLENGQIDSSISYARESLFLARKYKFKLFEIGATENLFQAFENKNTDSAFKYIKEMVVIKDEVFNQQKGQQFQLISSDDQLRKRDLEDQKSKFFGKVKLYVLLGIIFIFLLLAFILYRHNLQKQKAYEVLQAQKQEIYNQKQTVETTLKELKSTQSQLIQSEKMASLGELTAGIAHEIQNPLNFVNNFSEVNNELIEELKKLKSNPDSYREKNEEQDELLSNIFQNNEKINRHGKRADAIVKGMLQHSRTSTGQKEPTDINKLADEYLRLAYQGLRAKDKSFNVIMKTDFDESIGNINIIPQDIGRVLLNLYNNAFYAVNEKIKSKNEKYDPTVTVSTRSINFPLGGRSVEIKVSDNGGGIPQKIVDKIFQPFFTTKPTGQGTGLGLSLAYDIVKAHGGEIKVESKDGEGTKFTLTLIT